MNALLKGMRYNLETKIIEMSEDGRIEDIELSSEGETATQRMARVCNPIMNSINPDIKFTTEVPEDFPDGRLPSLDFTIEMMGGEIVHSYFGKAMKTPYVVQWESTKVMQF